MTSFQHYSSHVAGSQWAATNELGVSLSLELEKHAVETLVGIVGKNGANQRAADGANYYSENIAEASECCSGRGKAIREYRLQSD
jgi:hypothetical protein